MEFLDITTIKGLIASLGAGFSGLIAYMNARIHKRIDKLDDEKMDKEHLDTKLENIHKDITRFHEDIIEIKEDVRELKRRRK